MPDGSNFKSTNYKEIRGIIIDKKKRTNPEDFMVLIKPTDQSTYRNTVDLLDEMTINEVKRYATLDLFDIEKQLITATEGGGPMPGAAAPAAPAQ